MIVGDGGRAVEVVSRRTCWEGTECVQEVVGEVSL